MGRRVSTGTAGGELLGNINATGSTLSTLQTNQDLVLDSNGTGVITTNDPITITNSTSSTTAGTGAMVITGGLGVGENIWIGGTLNVGGAAGINNTTIGVTTPAAGTFTSLTATGLSTFSEISETLVGITGATGIIVHDYSATNIWYHTSIAANFTMNLTNVPTTNDRTIVVNLVLIQGATARYASAFQIDGIGQTIRWAGYAAPTPQANRFEIQSFLLTRVSSAWTVFGSLVSYG